MVFCGSCFTITYVLHKLLTFHPCLLKNMKVKSWSSYFLIHTHPSLPLVFLFPADMHVGWWYSSAWHWARQPGRVPRRRCPAYCGKEGVPVRCQDSDRQRHAHAATVKERQPTCRWDCLAEGEWWACRLDHSLDAKRKVRELFSQSWMETT